MSLLDSEAFSLVRRTVRILMGRRLVSEWLMDSASERIKAFQTTVVGGLMKNFKIQASLLFLLRRLPASPLPSTEAHALRTSPVLEGTHTKTNSWDSDRVSHCARGMAEGLWASGLEETAHSWQNQIRSMKVTNIPFRWSIK